MIYSFSFKYYILQLLSSRKSSTSNKSCTTRYCHTRNTGAVGERPLTDTRHAVADCHTRQAAAKFERIIPDARHSVRHGNNFFQCILVLACCVIPSRIVSRRRICLDVLDNYIESANCSIGMDFLADIFIDLLNSPISPIDDNWLACVISCR